MGRLGTEKDSQHLFKSGFSEEKGAFQLNSSELNKVKSVLLSMLKDFINVAEKYSLNYTMSGGSVLGTVRHQGFIPWDDDIDINLTRKDFNRLAEIFEEELGNEYVLCSPQLTPGHGLTVTQIKKKGTIYRSYTELSKDEAHCGIYIDIFIIENTFNNSIARKIQGIASLGFGYLCTCRKTYNDWPYLKKYLDQDSDAAKAFKKKADIGRCLSWLSLDWLAKTTSKVYSICKDDSSKYVTIPSGRRHFFKEMKLRSELCKTVTMEFEGIPVKIPAGYTNYLKALYGADFMKEPSAEERETHPMMEINFDIQQESSTASHYSKCDD